MLVYVISKQKRISFTLPSKIYGNYWIKDIDAQNNEKSIINISEYNGKWAAFSNKNVKIIVNNEAVRSVNLEEYQFLFLKEKEEAGYLILYTCPVNDKTMRRLQLSRDMEILIGSNPNNTISCQNELISPNHMKLTYQKKSFILEDLNSEYGTFVNDNKITGITRLNHGDVIFAMGLKLIVLGDSILLNNPLNSVHYDERLLSPLVEIKNDENQEFEDEEEIKLYDENEYFTRSPRFREMIEEETFKIESPPNIEEQESTPWLLTIGPMITMGSTSFVMLMVSFISMKNGNREFISVLPTLAISISMMAGTLLWPSLNRSFSKKQYKKKLSKIEKKYSEYLIKKEQQLKQIMAKQKQILLSNNISSSECYKMIANRSKNLWERELHQKDFLELRLGLGKVPLKVKFDYPAEHFSLNDDKLEQKMRLLVEQNKNIEGSPIIESLIEKNILALTGRYEYIKPYIDILILQIVALHSYYDLKIVIFTNKARKKYWNYMKQMPHIFSDHKIPRFFATDFEEGRELSNYLQKIITKRKDQCSKVGSSRENLYKNFESYYLIITDDYKEIKDYPIMNEILEQDGNLGFSLLIMHPSLANLPTQCKAFISLNDLKTGGIFESELNTKTQRNFEIEQVSQMDLNYCSLRLANIPIKNKNENYIMPKQIGFLEMYQVGNIEQLNPLERWQVNNPMLTLAVPVGIDMNGKEFKLDLHEKEAGPHGLIAGMTGSGKSEFIITYILSMAINFHPHEVQFVLIDYKGGGLVGAFENKDAKVKLPHIAGTITNLETAEINRALSSIESELKRRQALFNQARDSLGEGTIDIYKYQKYYREGKIKTPVSHLFIISDEFAELKSQQPEFMDQLISTARIGRSLGVHLILATQKPSGIVNDQIWSNSRFRVCLKVQEAADSNEVIKRPDAADIKETGRFYLQVGYNELFAMGQAAWAGAPYIPKDRVHHEKDESIIFINNIGKSIKTLEKVNQVEVKGEQLPSIVKYLDSLAEKEQIRVRKLWLEKLPEVIYIDELKKKYHFERTPFLLKVPFGEYDNPKAQEQGLLTLDLANKGNAVIYSMGEKNTIANVIIYSIITNYTSQEVNIYIMDFDSETMKVYKKSPQVGDVVFASETEKVDKLLKMLVNELESRKKLFQEYNGNYNFYIRQSEVKLPSILLMLTGYENFKENYEDKDLILSKIIRDGHKYGIYSIVTAITDRALRLSMRSNFQTIIPLKLSAPIEYNMLLGKKAPLIPDIENRGVALVEEEAYEFQTASVYEKEKLHEYLKAVCETLSQSMTLKAPPVPVLPEVVTLEEIENALVNHHHIPIGIEEETLEIATFDFTSSLITLINSEEPEMLNKFTALVIKETLKLGTVDTLIIDMKKAYSIFPKEIYLTEEDNLISKLDNQILIPNREKELFIFINGVDKWLKYLMNEKQDINNYLAKIESMPHCHLIWIDRLTEIKPYAYESWFKKMVSTDSGIWIGRGINNSTIYNLTTPLRTLSFPLPPNFGYVMKKGIATRIKLLEREAQDGK